MPISLARVGLQRKLIGGLVSDVLPAHTAPPLSLVYTAGLASRRSGVKSDLIADLCARRGWGFVRYDPRHGVGESPGALRDTTLTNAIADLNTILQHTPGRVVLLGSSFGGMVAAWTAAGVPWHPPQYMKGTSSLVPWRDELSLTVPERVVGVVLIAPAVRLAERWTALQSSDEEADFIVPSRYTTEPIALRPTAALDVARYRDAVLHDQFRRSNAFLLLAHGSRDDVVPVEDARAWFQEVRLTDKEMLVLPDDHRLSTEFHHCIERIDFRCRSYLARPRFWRMCPTLYDALQP